MIEALKCEIFLSLSHTQHTHAHTYTHIHTHTHTYTHTIFTTHSLSLTSLRSSIMKITSIIIIKQERTLIINYNVQLWLKWTKDVYVGVHFFTTYRMFVLSSSDRRLYEFTTYLGPLKKNCCPNFLPRLSAKNSPNLCSLHNQLAKAAKKMNFKKTYGKFITKHRRSFSRA